MQQQLGIFDEETARARQSDVVNVASVPQRSPFRYPGGKTWLIPTVRQWLKQSSIMPELLIEPFAGGGIVSLTAAFENLAEHITMVEKDKEVAAVWRTILSEHNHILARSILSFHLTYENIKEELSQTGKQLQDIAFRTILKNRVLHGGILAKGAGLIKNGENGRGLASRWYPKTLHDRIIAINHIRHKINFIEGDAFEIIEQNLDNENAYFFIDPPYTVAGKRLYTHYHIDHHRLFKLASQLKGKFMLTYDDTEEIRQLAIQFRLPFKTINMKTTHHLQKRELIISNSLEW